MKIHIMGYARHGKDTVSEYLASKLGFRWMSSSWFAAERIVFPILKHSLGYETVEACFNDRHNHRETWAKLISDYGRDDHARFSRELFERFDIYCGIRSRDQFLAGKAEGQFQLAIWVDASARHPPEGSGSCTVGPGLADVIINNNTTLDDLYQRINSLVGLLRPRTSDEFDHYERGKDVTGCDV